MTKSKDKVFRTTFSIYQSRGIIGEGGSGTIYEVNDSQGNIYALKLLKKENLSSDKLRRFKNEINFCQNNTHPNIIKIVDNGIFIEGSDYIPFYVMPLYTSSLRSLIDDKIDSKRILPYFAKILDGVEAAHLKGIHHRDLKPENILFDRENDNVVVADFGIARFIEENLLTAVETRPGTRLANFQYAAPEQRIKGREVTNEADIYALGLILNEMFTGEIPYGTDFKQIEEINEEYAYLDKLVAEMIKQSPNQRPPSIEAVKSKLIGYGNEFVSLQRISELEKTVIPITDIDDPLILNPVRLIGFDYQDGNLILLLSQEVNNLWKWAFTHMGSYTSLMGKEPERFSISGNKAVISAENQGEAQAIIDDFKKWLPKVNSVYEQRVRTNLETKEKEKRMKIQNEIEKEKKRERILKEVKF